MHAVPRAEPQELVTGVLAAVLRNWWHLSLQLDPWHPHDHFIDLGVD